MEHESLSPTSIEEILRQAKEEQFSKARPATRHFFNHEAPDKGQARTLTVHSWVVAELAPSDTRQIVRHLANNAVKEVVAMAASIAGEIIFRVPHLLPVLPRWDDGSTLFATHSTKTGADRFGVAGGNIVEGSDCLAEDVHKASERLVDLDPTYERDERLQLFCSKPLERGLIRACAKADVPCRVFGVHGSENQRSWVLTRDASACSLLIGRPSFEIPVKENHLVVGARFVVWITDPRLAVCVLPEEPK